MNEKTKRYFNRTLEHIHRVQKNMFHLITEHSNSLGLTREECRKLAHQVMIHDRSKFSFIQFEPYVELTEYYHQRKKLGNLDYDYPDGIREKVDLAVEDHYQKENHHPERLNVLDYMTKYELIEVVCDLQAMAEEFNEGSCRGYWENVWKKKQSQYFIDDYRWAQCLAQMDQVIRCFESEGE